MHEATIAIVHLEVLWINIIQPDIRVLVANSDSSKILSIPQILQYVIIDNSTTTTLSTMIAASDEFR